MHKSLVQVLRWIGVVLFHAGFARLVIWLNRGTPRVLLYHACEPNESDFIRDLSSNTSPDVLARHLDLLEQYYRVIPLAQLERGEVPDRAVVITFDDGYRSVYDGAFPLLQARGMPATVYLVTSVVDNGTLVWVNALNWLLHRHAVICAPVARRVLGAPERVRSPRDFVLYAQTHYDRARIESSLTEMWHLARTAPAAVAAATRPYLTSEQIRTLTEHGWTFGSHTAHHPNLRCLSTSECRAELADALASVVAMGGRASLSYPFGEFSADTPHVAAALGHTTVMHVGGVNRPLRRSAIARVPVTARSRAALFAEIEIVTPALAMMKRLARRSVRDTAARAP